MSTIWTPSGEYRPKPEPEQTPPQTPPGSAPPPGGQGGEREPTPEEMEAMAAEIMAALRQPMADHIVATVDQLLQLASLHLNRRALTSGEEAPDLAATSLAIDAITALVDGVGSRLGEYEPALRRTVEQLKLAFVQVSKEPG